MPGLCWDMWGGQGTASTVLAPEGSFVLFLSTEDGTQKRSTAELHQLGSGATRSQHPDLGPSFGKMQGQGRKPGAGPDQEGGGGALLYHSADKKTESQM